MGIQQSKFESTSIQAKTVIRNMHDGMTYNSFISGRSHIVGEALHYYRIKPDTRILFPINLLGFEISPIE
jgi:hypothetical protein